LPAQAAPTTFNLTSKTGTCIAAGDCDWTAPVLRVLVDNADITLTAPGGTVTDVRISIPPGITGTTLTLQNVVMETPFLGGASSPIRIGADAELTLNLTGINKLESTESGAGIRVASSATLHIQGAGQLTASSGPNGYSAGIGGLGNEDAGTIEISSGTVIAQARGNGGAGIGGGYEGSVRSISIHGTAHVTATGAPAGDYDGGGAGIGSGGGNAPAAAGLITIDYLEGATVKATGGAGNANYGAGAAIGMGGGDASRAGPGENGDPLTLPDVQIAAVGDTAALTCTAPAAVGDDAANMNVAYAWGRSTDGGAIWNLIAGATTSTRDVPNVTATMLTNNRYQCMVKYTGGGLDAADMITLISPIAKISLKASGGNAVAAVPTLGQWSLAALALLLAGVAVLRRKA
jgi:hypothetical protein